MDQPTQNLMRAVALDHFGGPEALQVKPLPIPELDPGEVLIRVEYAGVGEWDPFEREGGYAQMLGLEPKFPYILGSEGAGTIAAQGPGVDRFQVGDRVYAPTFLNPKGGFYAEFAAVNADFVSPIPNGVTVEQAGVMSGVGTTALRGLDDTLDMKPGESVLIFGAGGGIGHLAVQIAARMGARVFAVASGPYGVELVQRLGAEVVVDGRQDDVLSAVRLFAPQGLDAALLTAGGEVAERALQGLRRGGRVAYPFGIQPEPQPLPDIQSTGYYGDLDPDIIRRFNALFEATPLQVHIAQTFPLALAAQAHHALNSHYLGKLAFRVQS